MKLTPKERDALEMLRQLDSRQRDEMLGEMQRQLLANRITTRVGGMRRLKIVDNSQIEKHYGAPTWRPKKRKL